MRVFAVEGILNKRKLPLLRVSSIRRVAVNPMMLQAATSALILIDLQQGILQYPLAPHTAPEILEHGNQLARRFRAANSPVVYVRAAIGEFASLPVDTPLMEGPRPPPEALELSPELERVATDLVVTKRQWGAFDGTDLDQQLRRSGVRTIVLGGIYTNFGVESTARAAFDLGYEVVLVEDAISTFDSQVHAFAMNVIFPRLGRVRDTRTILEALR